MEQKKRNRSAMFMRLMGRTIPPDECTALHDYLVHIGFFTAPASTKYHGNYEGGLFDHSYQVTKCLLALTSRLELEWERPQSPYLIGMFHDLCKCDQYEKQADGYTYNKDLIWTGHGEKSVIMTQRIVDLTEEEALCIRWHMGAYEGEKVWNNLGAAIEQYPNILFVHTADMMATRICKV